MPQTPRYCNQVLGLFSTTGDGGQLRVWNIQQTDQLIEPTVTDVSNAVDVIVSPTENFAVISYRDGSGGVFEIKMDGTLRDVQKMVPPEQCLGVQYIYNDSGDHLLSLYELKKRTEVVIWTWDQGYRQIREVRMSVGLRRC